MLLHSYSKAKISTSNWVLPNNYMQTGFDVQIGGGGDCYFSKITSSIHCFTMICQRNNTFKIPVQGLPWWLSGKEFACQCRRHKFYLWLGKIPHATEQLSLCTTSIHNCWAHVPWLLVPACLEPMLCHKRSHCSPHSPQPEKSPCSNEDPAQSKINK